MSEALAQYLGWMAGRRQGNAQIWPDDNPVGTQTVQQMSAATPLGVEIAPGSMPTTRRDGTVPTAGMLTNPLLGPAVQQAANNALMFSPGTIRAYHGSPHKFDRFDPKYIGTGEGAQSYGHGLYFAGNEGVARGYRDKLSPNALDDLNSILTGFAPYGSAPLTAESLKFVLGKSKIQSLRDASNDPSVIRDILTMVSGHDLQTMTHSGDAVRAAGRIDTRLNKPGGHMYEVDLKVKPEQLLDWDKPLSQQAARDSVSPLLTRTQRLGDPEGAAIYDSIVRNGMSRTGQIGHRVENAVDATNRLLGAGIPGIRYLDGASRAAGQGSHNYVMFDPDLIEIVRRYGIAGLLGSGAVAAQGAPEQ